jgi:glycosyltransferase involved in cell wall biosynthesis
MKVVHLNTNPTGGAATACLRLHRALLNAGIDSKVITLKEGHFNDSRIQAIETTQAFSFKAKDLYNRIRNRIPTIGKPYCFFSGPHSVFRPEEHPWVRDADIVHLHWVSKFVDYRRFFAKHKTYCWTLHDFNPFSGGYHYPGEVDRAAYRALISTNEKIKIQALQGIRLHPISPSLWLAREARESAVLKPFGCRHIPNCLDTNIFKPRDRRELRQQLGWPLDKKVILFLAENINEKRKGFALLLEALHLADTRDLLLVAVGKSPTNMDHLSFIHVPFTRDEQALADVYAAADIYVTPSLEDNLPNTVLESMACGTPVVAFNTGGIPEMARADFSGFICEETSAAALAKEIRKALESNDLLATGSRARKLVEAQFSMPVIAERHVQYYREILNQA